MQALQTALDALVYRGQVERADIRENFEYVVEVAEYCTRGYVTVAQGLALCQMLGVGRGEFEAALSRASRAVN